jgi:hypothetical protein
MPIAASKKQYKFMMAILHGKNVKEHARGNPPRSIAAKYTDPGSDAPESKDNDRGGSWTAEHHKRHAEREAAKKNHKKDDKKHVKKSLDEGEFLSLSALLEQEALEKKDEKHSALKLVGNGIYRHLQAELKGMDDESMRELSFDTYKVSIRKHVNDEYSGRVSDGHKVIFQFTNKSVPEVAASLMSLFEWYLPEDEDLLDILDDKNLKDDAVHGGIRKLVDTYKKHNLGEIYDEMETIRGEMRNGVAVDLQQVEAKILKLFDRLEETMHDVAGKHNKLAQRVGDDMDELEAKLRELQSKISDTPKKNKPVEAVSSNPANGDKIHGRLYSYLTKPRVEIQPTGKIVISFGDDWEDIEKSNFLDDMRVKVLARK